MATREDSASEAGKRILLIEDEPLVARLFQREAATSRFVVDIASCSSEADALLEPVKYDAIVADIHLPGRSGIEFAQEVLSKHPEIPVVLLTGDHHVVIPDEHPLRQVRSLILKPWSHGEIGRVLTRCLTPLAPVGDLERRAPRTLLIEDSEVDVLLFRDALEDAEINLSLQVAERLSVASERLNNEEWDLVITDLTLPDGRGMDAVRRLLSQCNGVPLIVLSGASSWEFALESVRLGAQDYLLKDELTGSSLARSLRYAFERKRIEGELYRLANSDSLTNVGNRHHFRSRLRHAIQRAARGTHGIAVLFIDLDGFKQVNDERGHDAGDIILQETSQRLVAAVREADSVARLGGDEFAVLLEDVDSDEYAEIVSRRILRSVSQPVDLCGTSASVGASIGIARYPRDGQTLDELLTYSDRAMYEAKRTGGSRISGASLRDGGEHGSGRLALQRRLGEALNNDEFELYFQPQLDVDDGNVSCVEALLRWKKPDGTIVLPGAIIEPLEESGLMVEVGRWVIEEACRRVGRWRRNGLDLSVSVNVSPSQVHRDDLRAVLLRALELSGTPAHAIELEITESMFLGAQKRTLRQLENVSGMGCRLAIDDFGTGYSSLTSLHQVPFDVLKIDRSFVSGLETSKKARKLVQSVTELGRTLDLDVVAEGVDSTGQLSLLRDWSCDRTQGYLHARPMTDSAFLLSCLNEQLPTRRLG